MNTNVNKMDSAEVYNLFETINEKLDKRTEKQAEKPVEPIVVDTTAFEAAVERFENAIEEVRKPTIVENHHKHTIDFNIHSNWFFFSWVVLVFIILGLFWNMFNQRETINQFKENDLKYRYIRMIGQTNEENIYRLEQQFKYNDSIKFVRKQVEKYEELVSEQAERIERARRNMEEAERLEKEVKFFKKQIDNQNTKRLSN